MVEQQMCAAPKKVWRTPPDVARELGVEVHKILAWIHSGKIKAVNLALEIGGRPRWKIHQSEIDQFLEARTTQVQPAKPSRRRRRSMLLTKKWF